MAYKKTAYSQKLLDPRWQKKRLEILSKDEFTCQLCGDTEETLHVHHKYYAEGCEPWDEENDLGLVTLCAPCHKEEGNKGKWLKMFSERFKDSSVFYYSDLERIAEMLTAALPFHNKDVIICSIEYALGDQKIMKNITDEYFAYLERRKQHMKNNEKNG